jgi:arylsulfatase A-like enzyme
MPTILDLCEIGAASGIDGMSLVPVLSGGEAGKLAALSERLDFGSEKKRYTHIQDENENFMLRSGDYKYVIHRSKDKSVQMLFDIQKDPREYINLYGLPEYGHIAEQLRGVLRMRLAESGYNFVPLTK